MGRDKEGLRHRAQQGAGQADIQDTEVHWSVMMMRSCGHDDDDDDDWVMIIWS